MRYCSDIFVPNKHIHIIREPNVYHYTAKNIIKLTEKSKLRTEWRMLCYQLSLMSYYIVLFNDKFFRTSISRNNIFECFFKVKSKAIIRSFCFVLRFLKCFDFDFKSNSRPESRPFFFYIRTTL